LSSIRSIALLVLGATVPLFAQVNTGEIRLHVTDPAGVGLKASVAISNSANQYRNAFTTSDAGDANIKVLGYGVYFLRIEHPGFGSATGTVEVRSALPKECTFKLAIAPLSTSVQVSGVSPLIDPNRPSSIMEIGSQQIEDSMGSLPGRSVQDLVNSQPGWLYEGNAVLHPRGSEYQTQFVIDGIPLTDNRSPSFGPEIEADDVNSLGIYTAGIPAEYGRKMGGVVELNTRRETGEGLHGRVELSSGSYDTASGYAQIQDMWGRNNVGVSASGTMSAHYLNPVVPENFTDRGTTGDFTVNYERDVSQSDRLSFSVRHELSRFEVPNELVQERAGQLQTGDNFESMGTARYRHIFSPDSLATLTGMVRDNANDLYSNANSTPIIATQHNDFREGYFAAAYSLHHRNQEFKAGMEADAVFLHENFSYSITDPTQFDPGTPVSPVPYFGSDLDLEPSAFVEDLVRLGKWTVSAGLRWDHYQLLLNQSAFSPRLSIGRSVPSLNLVLHASLDRVFQTPSFENILITSSTWINQIDPSVLHLPVQPSKGTYYEGGMTEGFGNRMSLDVNVFRRDVRNYADDDQLLNTGVSYPIAFDKSVIYGAETKLTVVRLAKLSGYVSYSYTVGAAWFPVTGGLFLGDDAVAALNQKTGHFPDSQDQRNTLRTRFQYRLTPQVWFAGGATYGSGLPFAYEGDEPTALAEYGQQVIDRINFDRGRILPLLAADASFGADLYKRELVTVSIQVDGENLNDRLNIIDFGGLFSGNAIAPGRSYALRLKTSF
jgi:hypothetical protein